MRQVQRADGAAGAASCRPGRALVLSAGHHGTGADAVFA